MKANTGYVLGMLGFKCSNALVCNGMSCKLPSIDMGKEMGKGHNYLKISLPVCFILEECVVKIGSDNIFTDSPVRGVLMLFRLF